jgi:hypothetical protein
MVGLANVKADVRAIIDEIQVNEWRRIIFTGPHGTGKGRMPTREGLRLLSVDDLLTATRTAALVTSD